MDVEYIDDLWEDRSYAFKWSPSEGEDDDLLNEISQIVYTSVSEEDD